jgi:hypothetical protein
VSFSRIFAVVLALVISLVTLSPYRSHIFALHFVDEDDNIVIGNYVREGKALYSEVFSQHQPSMFMISAGIQNTFSVDNVLMVIKRHREVMIGWSILWFLILTVRFGWPLLLTGAVIELAKITLLGNLFLAESLVIYPLLYLVAHLCMEPKISSGIEKLFLVSIFWLLWYSLTPLWPLLLFLAILLFYKTTEDKQFRYMFVGVGAISLIGLLSITSFYDYVYNALYVNYKYYIPLTTPVGLFESIGKAFLAPIFAIFSQKSGELLTLIKVLSIGLLINLASLLLRKELLKAGFIFIVLGFTSLRYIDPGDTLYGVFHMLPWSSLLILFNFVAFTKIRLYHLIIWIIIMFASIQVANKNLFDYRDPTTDFYVHFSPSADIREAVKILSISTPQTLWVEPVMYWPHWRTGAAPYTSMVNYYGWMDQTPPMKEGLTNHLEKELPTIVWAQTMQGVGIYLDHYTPLLREGKPSGLYLRKDQVQSLTPQVRADLSYYRFEIN